MAVPLHTASAVGSLVGIVFHQLQITWRYTLLLQALQWFVVAFLLENVIPKKLIEVGYLTVAENNLPGAGEENSNTTTVAAGEDRNTRPTRTSAHDVETTTGPPGTTINEEATAQGTGTRHPATASGPTADPKMRRKHQPSSSQQVRENLLIAKALWRSRQFKQALTFVCVCFSTIGVWQTWTWVFLLDVLHPLAFVRGTSEGEKKNISYQVLAVYFFALILTACLLGGFLGSSFFNRVLQRDYDLRLEKGKKYCLLLIRRFACFLLLPTGLACAVLTHTFVENSVRRGRENEDINGTTRSSTSGADDTSTSSSSESTTLIETDEASLLFQSDLLHICLLLLLFMPFMVLWFFLFAILRGYGVLGLDDLENSEREEEQGGEQQAGSSSSLTVISTTNDVPTERNDELQKASEDHGFSTTPKTPRRTSGKRAANKNNLKIAEGLFSVATDVSYGLGSYAGGFVIDLLVSSGASSKALSPRTAVARLFSVHVFCLAPLLFTVFAVLFSLSGKQRGGCCWCRREEDEHQLGNYIGNNEDGDDEIAIPATKRRASRTSLFFEALFFHGTSRGGTAALGNFATERRSRNSKQYDTTGSEKVEKYNDRNTGQET
ncbi:unnamed protein product [Amoebophrya sp. A120]|nr:unnamed protein product [Amoebophrya sp. A120]|eukprot:GSA120T00019470001.1